MDVTTCPQCAAPAEIVWRIALENTDGPVEHCKVMCLNRHCFILPVGVIGASRAVATPATVDASTIGLDPGESVDRPPARP